MDSAALEFLTKILETPSPSGYERPVQEIVRQYVSGFADKVTTDSHGNVIAAKNPNGPLRVMLAGHCDQIGMLVQHIDAEGYLYCQTIGGWDSIQLIGQRMTIWTASGPSPAVIARKAIHLLTEEERKQVPKLKDLWLDIGAKDKAEAEGVVRIGDPVTFQLGFQMMRNEIGQLAGDGRQVRAVGRDRSPAAGQPEEAELRAVRRLDRAGRDRPARRSDQRLRHRSARGHRRRCDSRHRLPDRR